MDILLFFGVFFAMLLIGMPIGFAMLRYRLFEVDLVVGRALVYGAIMGFTVDRSTYTQPS